MKNPLHKKLTLVILGRSGSGKGTQARFVVRRLKRRGVAYIVTGDLMRRFIKQDGVVARRAGRIIATGGLIPAWLISYLWSKKLVEEGQIENNLIFDGAPRRLLEAELLDEVMLWSGRPLPVCVYLCAGEREVTKRLLRRGRADDTPRAIKNRLAYFPKDVLPVVTFYKKNRRLVSINGERSVKKVWQDIDQMLSKRLGARWPKH